MPIYVKIALALVPIAAFYLIYQRYFLFQPHYLKHVESFLYGIGLAVVIYFINALVLRAPEQDPLVRGFIRAALIEKAGLFLALLYLTHRRADLFDLVEASAQGIMLGLGFAALETVVLSLESNIILARLISSVPLHATTAGLAGYYLGRAHLISARPVKWANLAAGFLIPWVLHGAFDSFLFMGGSSIYLAAPLLIALILGLDYQVARSRTVPPREILRAMQLSFEGWVAIQKQKQYERWILQSLGSAQTAYSPFFSWNPGRLRLLLVCLSLGLAALQGFAEIPTRVWSIPLQGREANTFLVIVPAFFALNLILVGVINPDYFKDSIIRIPIIADVMLRFDNRVSNEITYDISARGCFLKTVEAMEPGASVELVFHVSGRKSPAIPGRVVWDNHKNIKQQFGCFVEFGMLPARAYRFILRYALYRFVRGLIFNLKIPGFETIRRLFLRPESVMQDERFFPAGVVIFEEGDSGDEFFMIKKGRVQIYRQSSAGERTTLAHLEAGQIFGEMAIAGNQPRNACAMCETDTILAVAAGEDLTAMIKNNPDFARKLIRLSSMRIHSSSAAMGASIDELEHQLRGQKRVHYAAFMLMLIGMGHARQGRADLRLDLARIRAELEVDDRTVQALLRYASRAGAGRLSDLSALHPGLPALIERVFQTYRLNVRGYGAEELLGEELVPDHSGRPDAG